MVETMVKHRLFEEYVIKGRFLYQQKLDTVCIYVDIEKESTLCYNYFSLINVCMHFVLKL